MVVISLWHSAERHVERAKGARFSQPNRGKKREERSPDVSRPLASGQPQSFGKNGSRSEAMQLAHEQPCALGVQMASTMDSPGD
jgi:hypothetical protein